MTPIKAIPNVLTLVNLALGVIGILFALNGEISGACYLIWAAVVFDFFDGFAARILRAQSPIGKQLDSLADLVSFGVLPGFVFYEQFQVMNLEPEALHYAFILVPLLSALRLAKFNIDENQTDEFIGLSTTAHAIFVSALFLSWTKQSTFNSILQSPEAWLIIMSLGSILLVSPVRLLALKFKSTRFNENWERYILIVLSITFIISYGEAGLAMSIIGYIMLSVIVNLIGSKK